MRTQSRRQRIALRRLHPLGRSLLLILSVAVILLVSAGPAAAKGPMPVAPESTGPLTIGQETEIVLRLEWPGEEIPVGLGPETYDMWGDELPWDLLAVFGTATSAEAMANAEPLTLTYQGNGRYTAAFTPDAAGGWTLVVAMADGSGGWQSVQEQPIQVGEPEGGSPMRAAVGVGAILVVIIAGGAALLRRRGASQRHESNA